MTSASSEHTAFVRSTSCPTSTGVTLSIPADVPGSSSRFGPPVSGSDPPSTSSQPSLVRKRLDPDWCSEYLGVETPDSGEPDRAPSALVSGMDSFRSWVSIAVSSSSMVAWLIGTTRPRFSTVEIRTRDRSL